VTQPVVSVHRVTKEFRIPLDKSATLKHRVVHLRSASRYRQLLAVDDVSFDVPEGQFLGIIGRNGSGKSTLLKMLARIYKASRGTIAINGALSPFLELGVGFNPELTARENVLLNGAILGLSRRDLLARMDEMIHFAELEQFADTKLKNFSSGMQVRLAFTVSIQANAAILLMDEVLAVGDMRFQAKCFDVFNQYKREGRTIILVTHDLSSVDLYADRALLFEHGQLLEDGRATDVTARYRRMVGQIEEEERIAGGGALVDVADTRPSEGRWGTGAMRVSGVRFLRGDGSQHVTFNTGDPMTVRIEGEAYADIDDVAVGVRLHRSDGSIVGGLNTKMARVDVPALHAGDRVTIDYAMPDLRILAGTYRATVALVEPATAVTYDWVEQAFEFRVVDEMNLPGYVDLGGRWTVHVDRHDVSSPIPGASEVVA
jgi:lipopolysaccharide transport system ATP-binding protein